MARGCQRRGASDSAGVDKVTVGELFDMVIADYDREKRRSLPTLLIRLQRIRRFFNNRRAINVDNDTCTAYAKERQAEGAKDATINRELAIVARAFRLGVKHRKITSQPVITLFAERNVRKGFVSPGVFEQILHHLTEAGSEAVADVAEFAWLTASRRGSCFGVQWPHVDRNEGLITFPAEVEKNGEPRQIPIVGQLHHLIEKRWKARKLGCEYVFHRNGRRIKAIAASWASACSAAGVPNLLFHDLRRSAVRNMVKAGVREKVAMEISGHRTRAIFDRYHIVDNADKREALTLTQASTHSRGNVVPIRKEA
jgi:integrase